MRMQASLLAGKKAEASPEQPISIKLVAPPKYVLSCTMFDELAGVAVLTDAIGLITTEIKQRGGACVVKEEPHATTMLEESKFMEQLSELQRKSQMVDGDDDGDEGN